MGPLEEATTESGGDEVVAASSLFGAAVVSVCGIRIGRVYDLALDRRSGAVVYLVVELLGQSEDASQLLTVAYSNVGFRDGSVVVIDVAPTFMTDTPLRNRNDRPDDGL